jgi:hypothetical protein
MMSCPAAVLGLAALGLVFGCLSYADVLVAHRVCRAWKDTRAAWSRVRCLRALKMSVPTLVCRLEIPEDKIPDGFIFPPDLESVQFVGAGEQRHLDALPVALKSLSMRRLTRDPTVARFQELEWLDLRETCAGVDAMLSACELPRLRRLGVSYHGSCEDLRLFAARGPRARPARPTLAP